MQWCICFIILLSLGAGFDASSNKRPRNNHKCSSCDSTNCPEYCFPEKTTDNDRESIPPASQVHCKIGNYTRAKELQCYGGDFGITEIDCFKPLPVKTLVKYSCPTFYHASASTVSLCESDGTWSEPIKCVPECGKAFSSTPLTPLILNGVEVQTRSQWPWAAALYYRSKNSKYYTYLCGATLVGDDLLVTAASCTYGNNTKSSNLLVLLDEFIKKIPKDEADKHGYRVKRAYRLPVFQHLHNMSNFNSDISVLVLESRLHLSNNLIPACLPSKNTKVKPFTEAIVAGWGYPSVDEEKASHNLLYMKVPLVDTLHCLNKLPLNFVKLLAFTTFCAGYRNGTGVCKGDTGSGLLTMSPDGLWELQGIVSVNLKYKKKPCHPHMYALYTKVHLFLDWIEKIVRFEEMGGPVKSKQLE